jgi:ligand-binding sensor domain-containing protein/class 3 adenylate cyclase
MRFRSLFALAVLGCCLCAGLTRDASVRLVPAVYAQKAANVVRNVLQSRSTSSKEVIGGLRPTKHVTQYMYDSWTEDSGLTQGAPNTIAQTPDGYIWLGTVYGLVRFDGVRFTAFADLTNEHTTATNTQTTKTSTKTKRSLKGMDVRALTVDNAGNLWIGSGGGGLLRFKNGFFTHVVDDTSRFSNVTTLLHDALGQLWVGTTEGLLRGDSTFTSYKVVPELVGKEITALAETPDHEVWCGTQDGLYRITPVLVERYGTPQGLPEELIRAVAVDAQGGVWIGTNFGAARWNASAKRFIPFTTAHGLSNNAVTVLYADRQQTLWIGTNNGGLNRMTATGRIDTITLADGLSGNTVLSIMEDREGGLWIGVGSGLNRIKDPKFTPWGKAEGVGMDFTSIVFQDSKGALWAGSYFQSGLNRFTVGADGTMNIRYFDTSDGLSGLFIASAFEDSQGRLWFGTLGGGLVKYEQGKFTTYFGEDIAHSNIRAIYEDSKHRLWLGTYGGGLCQFQDGAIVSVISARQGLSSDYILGMSEDAQGRLWIATTRGTGALSIVKPHDDTQGGKQLVTVEKSYLPDTTDAGITNKNAHFVVRDKQGIIWVGTPTELCFFRNDRFYRLSTATGMPDDAVFYLVQDEQNDFWISCNTGLVRLPASQVEAFAAGEITSVQPQLFAKADGMRSVEFKTVGQPMGCAARDGSLWFPTVKGLVNFTPARLRLNTLPPNVVIEEVLSNNTPLDLHATNAEGMLEIPPETERITLRFTALSLLFPDKVTFKHKLEGFDDTWIITRDQRRAYDYTNLPPGRYTFRVQASNNDGIWDEKGASITLYVIPKFYQTYPFYGLLFLCIAGVVAGVFRARLRQLQARERELADLVNERTREIRRQVKILDEQAREIETANVELQEKNQVIEEERMKSERLLLNILPPAIAERLKAGVSIIADKFESVTVMFVDIVGFTNLSARISPEHLVENLSMIFTSFDALAAKYKLEKIKTIGDAYMVVGGLPEPMEHHTEAMAMMALELLHSIQEMMEAIEDPITVRVGIHTGPVVAGVIGVQKFAYDLWGDTVNTASRMESSGEAGKIHVTEDVYRVLHEKFVFVERGIREVKGKGTMKTYFLLQQRDSKDSDRQSNSSIVAEVRTEDL